MTPNYKTIARVIIEEFWLDQVRRTAVDGLRTGNVTSIKLYYPTPGQYQKVEDILKTNFPESELKVAE